MNKGLYIHFPFCERKCSYCDFYSIVNESSRQLYTKALSLEIEKLKPMSIDTVYFGGGTPSLMNGIELKGVLDSVYKTLKVSDDVEITLEANPMSLGENDKLDSFKAAGVNRLSLGVQSFCDVELSALGRGHCAKDAVDTVKAAQRSGFDNVSLDLMFAIPHQTVKSFENTLDTAIELGVQHISVYALSIEEKTVFGVKQKRGENLFLPSEEQEAEMYFLACDKLVRAGFEHYEISNFALNKKRSRHNMKYWRAEEYIGIGPGAHSYLDGVRYSTPADVRAFCNGAEKEDCYTNTPLDRAEEYVFLSLRLKDGLDLQTLKEMHGINTSHSFENDVAVLVDQGFCHFDGKILSLTEKGFFVSNSIIVKILESLQFPS